MQQYQDGNNHGIFLFILKTCLQTALEGGYENPAIGITAITMGMRSGQEELTVHHNFAQASDPAGLSPPQDIHSIIQAVDIDLDYLLPGCDGFFKDRLAMYIIQLDPAVAFCPVTQVHVKHPGSGIGINLETAAFGQWV
jgi:hypothetical protein